MKYFWLTILTISLLTTCQKPDTTLLYTQGLEACIIESGEQEKDIFERLELMKGCMQGKPIPQFEAKDANGVLISNKDLKDQVTVINFWSTTCPPCLAEMPGLNEIVEHYKGKKIRFLGFTADKRERLDKVFFGKRQFDFEIFPRAAFIIDGTFKNPWGLPLTIVVDKKGHIKKIVTNNFEGQEASDAIKEELVPLLDELLP